MQENEGWLTHLSAGVVSQFQIPSANHLHYKANRRCEIVMEYIGGHISRAFLESKYPFIAEELDRQGLYEKIKEILKVPTA